MIFHHFKTDWQRLRIPICCVWTILLFAALPWLLHDTSSYALPMTQSGQGNSELRGMEYSVWSHLLWEWQSYAVLGATFLLSTAIGMHDLRWQPVSPVRRWQRLIAKVLALLSFIVGPQVLLGACVMLLHGFPVPLVLMSAAAIALTLILVHGTVALFGYQCGSFWSWVPAIAFLAATVFLPNLLFGLLPQVLVFLVWGGFGLGNFFYPWAEQSSPRLWVYMVIALLSVAVVPRLLRTRPGTFPGISSAVVALLLSGWLAQLVSPVIKLPEIADLPIEPVVASGDMRQQEISVTQMSGRTALRSETEARISTLGASAGMFVDWTPNLGNPGIARFVDKSSSAALAAIRDAVPAPLVKQDDSSREFITLPDALISREEPVASVPVVGIVFHYEKGAVLPLSETSATGKNGPLKIHSRLHFDRRLGPLAEVVVQYPITETANPFDEPFVFVLHLPKQNVCVILRSKIYQWSPMPGGGMISRLVLAYEDGMMLDRASLENASLILLRQVVSGVVRRKLTLPPIPAPDWKGKGVMLGGGDRISQSTYLTSLRPQRPDPATCSETEFIRYLRLVGGQFPWDNLKLDLAEYAPRFPRQFAEQSAYQSVAYTVADTLPETSRSDVTDSIESPARAFQLADTLLARDWQADAREQLLACLAPPFLEKNEGTIGSVVAALTGLEDPTTYPALVSTYETTGSGYYYEMIRRLPGIKPQLDEVMERLSQKLSTSLLSFTSFDTAISNAVETYEAPVSHGNPTALAKLLEFWENLPFGALGEVDETPAPGLSAGDPDAEPTYSVSAGASFGGSAPNLTLKDFTRFFRIEPAIPHTLEAWRAFMKGKTAADFTYDPLGRRWQASSIKL